MRMYLCLEDVSLHLISLARWKMHTLSPKFCHAEHQRPKGARRGGKRWVGRQETYIMCFGNNHAFFLFYLVGMGGL